MKRHIILLVSSLFAWLTLTAQDIIVTNNADKIEAQITEISKEQVKYLEYGNQEGPVYILPTEDISSIIFANGQVKVYNHETQNTKSVVITNNETESLLDLGYITRSGNTYYHNGIAMRGSMYASFLQKNCIEAYQQYTNAHILSTVGWVFLGVGLGLDLGFSWWLPYVWIPSGILEIACIPTLIVGYVRMHRSADTFNMLCANKAKTQAYLSLTTNQNGVGIALHF